MLLAAGLEKREILSEILRIVQEQEVKAQDKKMEAAEEERSSDHYSRRFC